MDWMSLLSGGLGAGVNLLTNAMGGTKYGYHKDPYVQDMQLRNDEVYNAILQQSPEAQRRAQAMSLQRGKTDAQAGALNSALSQNIATGGGQGDANTGAVAAGARSMANSLGASAQYDQALGQGHQVALEQEQQKHQQMQANAMQGAQIGDMFIQNTEETDPTNPLAQITAGVTQGTGLLNQLTGVGKETIDNKMTEEELMKLLNKNYMPSWATNAWNQIF